MEGIKCTQLRTTISPKYCRDVQYIAMCGTCGNLEQPPREISHYQNNRDKWDKVGDLNDGLPV